VKRLAAAVARRLPAPRWLVIAVPYLWIVLFFAVPFLIALKISFASAAIAMPPYTDLLQWEGDRLALQVHFGNYLYLLRDSLYVKAYLSSLKIAAIATTLCLLVGYPMAYAISRLESAARNVALMFVVLPSWTSFLIRIYAWVGILKNNGLLNNALMGMGLIDEPLAILHTPLAVYIGIVYAYLPFMVLPLSRAGIIAGTMLVGIPVVGEFVIPEMLGGPDTLMIGRVLWQEFFMNRDWPVASAVAIVMLFVLVAPIMLLRRAQAKAEAE
jgi:putrescine transport system permease protein